MCIVKYVDLSIFDWNQLVQELKTWYDLKSFALRVWKVSLKDPYRPRKWPSAGGTSTH